MARPAAVVLVLSLFVPTSTTLAQERLPTKQSNIGDSISQGFGANGFVGDQPSLSWVQGTDNSVQSTFTRFRALNASLTQEPESVSGAELVGGGDSFPAQAQRICAQGQKPQYVSVLLGGNDVCNRARSSTNDASANLYSVTTWTNALRAGMDQLAQCLPAGATVQLVSMPRVDFLYTAGRNKSFWCPYVVWSIGSICRVVTAEDNVARRNQIGQRINQYNDAIRAEVQAYTSNTNGRNPNGIRFATDWVGSIESKQTNTSVGSYVFQSGDINGFDCFHPNATGQRKIACAAWSNNPFGGGAVSTCFR